ncbi:GNAT family N-acetyltransferase [Chitinimonas arctica]|uniref:GNAT family N-acetyltransferase n=1 Tax=Chitinimonas arctica TaxID=2594795 RepID=UPI0015D2995C|nr:GNAT family N-acetyltransferase [Chitinimonas arctica]
MVELAGSATVRPAEPADAAVLAALAGELGYARTQAELEGSLARLLPRDDHIVLVAQLEGEVCGWLHAAERDTLESGCKLEILGLVVASASRGHGLGARLMAAAENWGGGRGLEIAQLRSNIVRTDAHRFYAGLGYQVSKTSLTLQKTLPALPGS